ncbi:hypothetical protein RB195_022223 [Necator americanus]|uniref:Uncharacterized protein n=1 Tax=Necator americanus TaxID=51031 RepID=A0ABR1EEE8_NECAM
MNGTCAPVVHRFPRAGTSPLRSLIGGLMSSPDAITCIFAEVCGQSCVRGVPSLNTALSGLLDLLRELARNQTDGAPYVMVGRISDG